MKVVVKTFLGTLAIAASACAFSSELQLPLLGDASSSLVSPQQERELGREWLRLYRSQIPTSSDHQIIAYLEQLLGRLAPNSQLRNPNLALVLAENETINAFAVPGGVIGVHTGLLSYAESEHQLASVLSHELAHLSQRHYARRLEQQKNMALPFYAAMLGSLVLAATSSSDAGMAALMSTQAAAMDAQLRFSRQNEQEADRIGMQTMVNAGMDPRGAAEMFEQMQHAARFSRRPPEFLLTHPVTERRIADARNRTLDMPRGGYSDNIEFHLMRARVKVSQNETPQTAVQRFKGELEGESLVPAASRYGLALAQTRAGQPQAARETLAPLLERDPERLTYQLLAADIDLAERDYKAALKRLNQALEQNPESYAARMHLAEALMKAEQFQASTELLEQASRKRQDDPNLWYLLAEVSGLAGNILLVHEARAEYFILNGRYIQAIRQLHHGLKRAETPYRRTLIQARIKQVEEMQRSAERLM